MHRRILALVAVLALGLAGVAAAAPAKKRKPKADHGTIRIAAIGQKGKTVTLAGSYHDNGVIGSGAVLLHVKSSPDSSGAMKLTVRITVFTPRGSLSGTGSALQVGTKLNKGKYTLKKGTAGLKGWKTNGTFSGSAASTGAVTLRFKGKVTK